MKRKIKKILGHFPPAFLEYFEMIFSDASENQIRFFKSKTKKFRSYTQLKKHQKNVRRVVAGIFAALLFVLIGIVLGPIFFPQPVESEVYIPNGKGDILVANISKNQATVIFKTLDSANNNKPLATRAIAEVYSDQDYSKLVRRTSEDDYAVTHIIPIDSLQEGNVYYIRITATDASKPAHSKVVSSWGEGSDPIKMYATGDLIPTCQQQIANSDASASHDSNKPAENNEAILTPVQESTEGIQQTDSARDAQQAQDSSLHITDVQNENYLQPKNKVQTIISWTTNLPATTVLTYGEGSNGEKNELSISSQKQTRHAAILMTLKAGTTYYFKAKSVDENGNVAMSEEYSLRTPRPEETITQKISDNFKALFGQIKPN